MVGETVAPLRADRYPRQFGGDDRCRRAGGHFRCGRLARVIDVNLMGTIHCCKAALPHMKAQASGDIINISTTSGRRAAGLMGAYSTAKFGLTGFTEGLRQELGAYGVRVSIVEPGATATEVAAGISRSGHAGRDAAPRFSRAGVMQPADIAEAIMLIVGLPRRANVAQILIRPTDDIRSPL